MSTIPCAGPNVPTRRCEGGKADTAKSSAASTRAQPRAFGAVLEKMQTASSESRRPRPQPQMKPNKQTTGDTGHRLRPDERDSIDAALSSFPAWMRAEGAIRPETVPSTSCAPRAGALSPGSDRVLVGTGGLGAEARVRIGGGALAGTEIQLVAVPGGLEARVLTVHAGSRQTLSVAMEEIAQRLRRKGHSLRLDPSDGRGQGRGRDGSRGRSDHE
jgi:hypothetical protein